MRWLFWAAIIGLVIAALIVDPLSELSGWLLLAALAVGTVGALTGVFEKKQSAYDAAVDATAEQIRQSLERSAGRRRLRR